MFGPHDGFIASFIIEVLKFLSVAIFVSLNVTGNMAFAVYSPFEGLNVPLHK